MKFFQMIARGTIVMAAVLCICALLVWFVIPYIILGWDLLFPHYNHNVAILSSDVECEIPVEGSQTRSIVLPKGLMIYAPCRHDFDRLAMDESCTYKVYLRLDPKTLKTIIRDSDPAFVEKTQGIKRLGELEEKYKQTSVTVPSETMSL